MRQLWLDYNDNLITDDELRKELEASNKRVKENDNILAFHKNEYEKESLGKVTSIARKRKLNESKYISEAKSLDKSGKLDGPELEQIERVMGPEYVGSLLKLNYESMKRGAVSDKDMGKAFALVNEFINTPDMDFYKAIKRSEKIGGKAGRRAFWQMSEIYKERIDKDVEVGTPLQSYRTDFFEQVTRFVATGDKKGDWYDDRMLRFDKWVEKNPDAEIEDYYDFRYKELKTDVAEFVGKYNAPQMTTQDAGLPDFDNMTDEELEAYLNE